jgi:hypothetical protein
LEKRVQDVASFAASYVFPRVFDDFYFFENVADTQFGSCFNFSLFCRYTWWFLLQSVEN